jgi:hypothetical protein
MSTEFITRRTALKFAGVIMLAARSWSVMSQEAPLLPRGYGRDPNLFERPVTWPRTLAAEQLTALAVLCDIVLPAEPPYPSARSLGVHEFIDEWVSAPYPQMRDDRRIVLTGLDMLDESIDAIGDARFGNTGLTQQLAVFETFCSATGQKAEFAHRIIQLICGGYYTTRQGHAALGYVGNVALATFDGPPPEIIRHLHAVLDSY